MAGAEEEKEEETEETNDATLVSSFRSALKARTRLRAEASSGEHIYTNFRRAKARNSDASTISVSGFRVRSLPLAPRNDQKSFSWSRHTLRSFPPKVGIQGNA